MEQQQIVRSGKLNNWIESEKEEHTDVHACPHVHTYTQFSCSRMSVAYSEVFIIARKTIFTVTLLMLLMWKILH
jgi:hypothetical protein